MTAAQRRITLAVCLIVGMSLSMTAGLTFLVVPMAEGLDLPDNVVEDILAIPSAAALIMVFSAGQLSDRLGARRILVLASIAFSVGSGLLMIAGNEYPAEIGLAICAGAAITMLIVGVTLLQQSTVDGPAQVSAFTSFGVVFPLAFLVFPVGTAWILDSYSWRVVPFIWILVGLSMLGIAMLLIEPGPKSPAVGEWGTPLLAGIAFAAGARAMSEIDDIDVNPPTLVVAFIVVLIAAGAFVVLKRRLAQPSFSTEPIRGGQLPLLLIAVMLVATAGLLTYVSIAIQYLYDMTPFEASLAVIPAQIGAIVGAKFMARYAIRRWGGLRAATMLMLALAMSMLPLLAIGVNTPLLFLTGVAAVFSFAWMAVLTVLNAEVMRRAPQSQTSAVSAFRTGASSMGAAVGVGTLGTLVLSRVPVDAGINAMTLDELTEMMNGLRLDGLLASLIALLGCAALVVVQRRSKQDEAGVCPEFG